MRRDMRHLITESPRIKSAGWPSVWTRAKLKRMNPEDLPRKLKPVSMSGRWSWGRSQPLEAFLNTRLGLPWDETYSIICKNADVRTFAGRRMREMVKSMVTFAWDEGTDIRWRKMGFIVDNDGILRMYKKEYKRKKDSVTMVRTSTPGIWYELRKRVMYHGNAICVSSDSIEDLEPAKFDVPQWYRAEKVKSVSTSVNWKNEVVGIDSRGYVIREVKKVLTPHVSERVVYKQADSKTVKQIDKAIQGESFYYFPKEGDSNHYYFKRGFVVRAARF